MAVQLSTQTVVQASAITVAPAINDQQFQGYYIHPGGSLEPIDCPSASSLFTTSNYAVCCGIGATTCSVFPTKCVGTVLVGVSSAPCATNQFCQTVSIFDQYPANSALIHSQIICAPSNWAAFSIYRNVVTATSATVLSTLTYTSPTTGAAITNTLATTTFQTSASSATTASGSNVSAGGISASSQTAAADSSSNSGSQNLAWIAGVVIGAVVLIALLALLIWTIRTGKWKRTSNSTAVAGGGAPAAAATHHPEMGSAHVASPPAYGYTPYHELGRKDTVAAKVAPPQEMDSAAPRAPGPFELPESAQAQQGYHGRPQ
ncbi:hypothetical protein AMS68_006030 [Peltaster fructicola]|uniref:Mid2 domain-containing protein n=1 Tax=Peltaster fructicola TaxID=286661 RepID=A0A6H0Y0I0_9PEZI|nr:hypothetical protein AMS68_006030 [Peltaster fructicola]